MIKNRNIAAEANIDLSKRSLVDGRRTFWEDFDDYDGSGTDADNIYGLGKAGTGTAATNQSSFLLLEVQTEGNVEQVFMESTWTGAAEPRLEVRFKTGPSLANTSFQIGWAENVAITGGANDCIGNKDWAYLELSTGNGAAVSNGADTSGKFVLRSRTAGDSASGTVTNTNVADVAVDTTYSVSVQILSGGGVLAKVGKDVLKTASAVVPTGNTDWRPFLRIRKDADSGSGDRVLLIDTMKVSEDRV